jgi:hypothetical protein
VAEAICDGLTDGKSLYRVLSKPGMPSYSAVCEWLNHDKAFAEQYARARELQETILVGDIMEMADRTNGSLRSQRRIDARMSYVGQVRPKKHGWWADGE